MTHAADFHSTIDAKKKFPRGLTQPPGLFRFSEDALLLAAFARPAKKETQLLDLGCGCGVVAFAALLGSPACTALGVDVEQELLAACSENAKLLGLQQSVATMAVDLRCDEERRLIAPDFFDLAYANPPYYQPERGRLSQESGCRTARFDEAGLLPGFLSAAYRGLKNKARLALVFPAARVPELLQSLQARRLQPRRLRSVHSRADKAAHLVLVEARKDVKPDLVLEPPLILHEGDGANTRLTKAALDFCPFLACNA